MSDRLKPHPAMFPVTREAAAKVMEWVLSSWQARRGIDGRTALNAIAAIHVCSVLNEEGARTAKNIAALILRDVAELEWASSDLLTGLIAAAAVLGDQGSFSDSAENYVDLLWQVHTAGGIDLNRALLPLALSGTDGVTILEPGLPAEGINLRNIRRDRLDDLKRQLDVVTDLIKMSAEEPPHIAPPKI